MRKWLRAFLAWMDRRFPERVVITQATFDQLMADVKRLKETSDTAWKAKVDAEINKFNLHMGFGGTVIPKGMEKQFSR